MSKPRKNGASRKDNRIFIRISTEEKATIVAQAKRKGFDSVSAYLLYLARLHRKPSEHHR